MWEIMTIYPPFLRLITLLMAGILSTTRLLADFAMASLPLILLMRLWDLQAIHLPTKLSSIRKKSLFIGANFASAGSGYDDQTAILSHAIPLSQQLEYFKEYQGKLAKLAGSVKAKSIVNDALYIIGAGGSDSVLNYYRGNCLL